MAGGKKGLLVNSGSLCKSNKMASQKLVGQNGKRSSLKRRLRTGCGGKASRKHRRKTHRHHMRAVR
jgi:hypothetical protein